MHFYETHAIIIKLSEMSYVANILFQKHLLSSGTPRLLFLVRRARVPCRKRRFKGTFNSSKRIIFYEMQ